MAEGYPGVSVVRRKAPAAAEHDRGDHQRQFVDEFVLDQRVDEPEAGSDEDVAGYLLPQLRDSFTTSPARTVVFFRSGSCMVEEMTYLALLFRLSAGPAKIAIEEA